MPARQKTDEQVNVTGLIEVVHLVRWYRYRETAWELAANDERDTNSDLQKLTKKVLTKTVTKNSLVKVQVYSRPTILPKNLSKPVSIYNLNIYARTPEFWPSLRCYI